MGKLSVKGVQAKIAKAEVGRHADGQGLYLHIREGGSWAWVLRVVALNDDNERKRRDISLGSALTLAEAREEAAKLRTMAKKGLNPTKERRATVAKPAAPTFKAAAEACHKANEGAWSQKHADAWLASITAHAFSTLGKKRVSDIDAQAIADALKPIWTAKPSIARKVRHRIFETLNFAHASKWRADAAPADSVRVLLKAKAQPKKGNFPSMPYPELPAYIAGLLGQQLTMGRLALLFTIATAARSGETRLSRLDYINAEARLWQRPAEIMKGRVDHDVTLNRFAFWLLDRAKGLRIDANPDRLIFPGSRGKPLSDMTLSKILRDAALPYVPHGFRATFRTWAAEQMPLIPEPVAEYALAHTVPDEVQKAYQRAQFVEMRRELLDAWGDYMLSGLSTPLF